MSFILYYPKDSPNIKTWVPSDLPLSDQCAPLRLSSPYSMKQVNLQPLFDLVKHRLAPPAQIEN